MSSVSFWSDKQVLVTGHTGFKGTWLCKILETAGAHVIGYALKPDATPNFFELCNPGVNSIIADIRDFEKLLSVFEKTQPEIVIHMAAQPLVLDSYKMPRYTYDVNIMGTVNILECAKLCGGVRSLLNVTTDKVYLNRERSGGYTEDEQLCGYDPYSNSKSCSELVTYSYINSFLKEMGVPVSTARSGNVIGGGDFSLNRLIPDCAKALAKGETVKIRNPGSIRPYQHVLDTLFAYLDIAEAQYKDHSFAGAYNIGPDEDDCKTSGELADSFCNAWGMGSWEHVLSDNPHESGVLKLDCSKIAQALGLKPRWGITQSVEETARWYKAYFGGDDYNAVMLGQIEKFAGG